MKLIVVSVVVGFLYMSASSFLCQVKIIYGVVFFISGVEFYVIMYIVYVGINGV
jgi:hypothetical protein